MNWIRQIKKYYKGLVTIIILIIIPNCKCGVFRFSNDQMQIIGVYSKGDTFKMINTKSDTFTFVIKDKILDTRIGRGGFGCVDPEYEQLTYNIEITSPDGKTYNGEFYSSTSGNPLYIRYKFSTGSCYFGSIEIVFTSKNDTVIEINDVVYNDAYCDEYACFAKGVGFIKFRNSCDTLTLIK